MLLSGVPGVPPGNVVILGAGTVGLNAARTALGLAADVSILDVNIDRLRHVDDIFGGRVVTVTSNSLNIEGVVPARRLARRRRAGPRGSRSGARERDLVATMKEGAVIVDVAVDQGSCVATMRPTTLEAPIYQHAGVVHYGVANMPALVPRTSTFALTNATLPYAVALATLDARDAVRADPALARGVNIWRGHIVHEAVADTLGEKATPLEGLLAS